MTDNNLLFYEASIIFKHISENLIIPTKSLTSLWKEDIKIWLAMSSTGAIIYARPRVGKTVAIKYLAEQISDTFAETIPVIEWNISDHAVTERNFYASLLMAIGAPEPNKGATALILKERVLNYMVTIAHESRSSVLPSQNRVILICDEAHQLMEKDFNWLMDLYNNLQKNNVSLTTLLFGTYELKYLKTHMIVSQKDQIVGRFMIDEHEFQGIRSKEELALCLSVFDRELNIPDLSETIIPTNRFFPDAYANGEGRYMYLTDYFWNAFEEIKAKFCIPYDDIPMKYFIKSVVATMTIYGVGGYHQQYFIGEKEVKDVVEKSGYSMSGGGASNAKFISKRKTRKTTA